MEKAAVGITASAKAKLCRNRCMSNGAVILAVKSRLDPLLAYDRPDDNAGKERQQGHCGHDHQEFWESDGSHDQSIRPVTHKSSIRFPAGSDPALEIAALMSCAGTHLRLRASAKLTTGDAR